jgi:hypothetical protein
MTKLYGDEEMTNWLGLKRIGRKKGWVRELFMVMG